MELATVRAKHSNEKIGNRFSHLPIAAKLQR